MREPYDIRDSHSSCKKLIMNINQYLSHYNSHYTLYEKQIEFTKSTAFSRKVI